MRLAFLAGIALAAACAHAPAGGPRLARVTAEGWAPLDARDPAGARRRALADAERAAVEKAAGATITARTRVSNAVALDDTITARVSGSVRSYEVVSERDETGFHKTTIRALVALGADANPPPGVDARVAVRLRGDGAEEASAGVRRALLARGFTVVDGASDLVLDGVVVVRDLGFYAGFRSRRARVSLALRRPATGEVLAARSREASALDPTGDVAGAKAAETAGELGAEELAKDAVARLSD